MNLWKRKLAAFLHDPPSKCLDIRTHGERSDLAFRQAGFTDGEIGEYTALADHTAAAADRLPFPSSRPAALRSAFDGVRNAFIHPLGKGAEPSSRLPFHKEFPSAEAGAEAESSVQPILTTSSLARFGNECHAFRGDPGQLRAAVARIGATGGGRHHTGLGPDEPGRA